MLWALLSIISGLGDATMFASMKKLKKVSNSIVVWAQYAFALPFMLIFLYINYPQRINSNVYWIAALNGILLTLSTYLLFKAIKISDLSISMPMLSVTPLFLVFTSYLMLDEMPTFYGFIGIFLIVIGAYSIHIKDYKKGFFYPFRALLKDKGSFYVLIVAFIFSISANLGKMGIINSSPMFYAFAVYLFASVVMAPLIILDFNKKIKEIKADFSALGLLGISSAFMMVTSAYAMLIAIVPYVISLKRSSVIFAILFGYLFFDEKNIKNALIGTIIMLIGGILITLF
ncbi:DMT family transporter [Candidatus Woesearchaeota archaeon]|nr:DMT family transporter [Candidatus Woesearchaeota archaeon]